MWCVPITLAVLACSAAVATQAKRLNLLFNFTLPTHRIASSVFSRQIMIPLHSDSHLTFRFIDDWIIPCFGLDRVGTGVEVKGYKSDPATATFYECGWSKLPVSITMRNGEMFIAIPK